MGLPRARVFRAPVLTATADAAMNAVDAVARESRSPNWNATRRTKRHRGWLLPHPRVQARQHRRHRNAKKRTEVAGVDGVVAAADGEDRVLRRKQLVKPSPALQTRPSLPDPCNGKSRNLRAKSVPHNLLRMPTKHRPPLCCR